MLLRSEGHTLDLHAANFLFCFVCSIFSHVVLKLRGLTRGQADALLDHGFSALITET